MDFSIPEATEALVREVRQFVDNELVPLESQHLGEPFSRILPTLERLREQVRRRGWWLPQLPRPHGSLDLDCIDYALVGQQLGRSPYGHFVCNAHAPDAGNMELLLSCGTPEQQRRWLDPLLAGRARSCFAMTEPDRPGSNPVWMETTAIRDGDHYVIRGHKWFATGADGAAFIVVMAVTAAEAAPHERASLFVVPTDAAGVRLVRNISTMGHAGDGWDSHGELEFDHCRVPVENRLGAEGSGFRLAQARLGPGRIHHCMRWLGIAERCFEMMCHRATTRELAPGELLASRQTVQHWIADSRAEIDSARWMVLHAAWKIDRHGARNARVEVSTIKFFVADVLRKVIDRAIQVHGALGISDDTVLARFYRQERASRIYDGPDEVHRTVVARHETSARRSTAEP